MTNEQTPREFFIAYSKYTNAYEVLEKEIKVGQRFYDSYSSAYVNCDELIKTVEYSAYEKLQKENDQLKYELQYAIEIIEKNRRNSMEGIAYND